MYEELKLGSSGEDVIILQEKLKRLGFYNAVINGVFGLSTEVGVKAFQGSVGLADDGIVTSEVWDALNNETDVKIATISIFPNLSLGSSGSYVRDLQTKLRALLFYSGDVTGEFDADTEIAVKRFQLNNEITANGVVNNTTWNLINSFYGNLNSCVLEGEDNNSEKEDDGFYIVKEGDTLYAIARRFNTSVDAIKSVNNLSSNTLQIGQRLKIPTDATDNYFSYTVQKGDSLSVLAQRYNTTVDAIKGLNNLVSDLIIVGQTLKIPTSNTSTSIDYVVKSGDTMYAIARRFNTSVDTIKSLNNLSSNTLQIGQVLKIPTSAGVNYITYIVKNGDTLYAIARRYDKTVNEIKNLNNLTSDILQIGQSLKIPL